MLCTLYTVLAVCDVRVPGDPAAVCSAPEHVAFLVVEQIPVGAHARDALREPLWEAKCRTESKGMCLVDVACSCSARVLV